MILKRIVIHWKAYCQHPQSWLSKFPKGSIQTFPSILTDSSTLSSKKNQYRLSGQTARPPYRAIGYRYTYRTYVFQVSQGIALYPLKLALSQPRGEGGSSCPGYRAIGGYRWDSIAYRGLMAH